MIVPGSQVILKGMWRLGVQIYSYNWEAKMGDTQAPLQRDWTFNCGLPVIWSVGAAPEDMEPCAVVTDKNVFGRVLYRSKAVDPKRGSSP